MFSVHHLYNHQTTNNHLETIMVTFKGILIGPSLLKLLRLWIIRGHPWNRIDLSIIHRCKRPSHRLFWVYRDCPIRNSWWNNISKTDQMCPPPTAKTQYRFIMQMLCLGYLCPRVERLNLPIKKVHNLWLIHPGILQPWVGNQELISLMKQPH